jgi:hypothetical protein
VVPAPAPAPVTPPVDLAADVTPTPDDAVLPEQVADAVDPDAVAAAPDAGPVPSAPVAAPARPASHPCVGRVCRLDFVGMAGGLPVRDAQLEDGQAVEWARQFGSASKLGFIPSGPSVNVEVRAVGFKDGVPIAASVLYRSRGKVLSGVISLTVGNKQLSLLAE